ncbi:MAG: PilC/PilY family type IV pilus protein [Pseudomonadota bacterium]
MKDHLTKSVTLLTSAVACGVLLFPISSQAGPGALADSPLFLQNSVEPNILFTIDDSGSMDWSLMTPEQDGKMFCATGLDYFNTFSLSDNRDFYTVPSVETLAANGMASPYDGVWRARNSNYNAVFYDPTLTYAPWPGEDSNGNLFTDANPKAALLNPWTPATGSLDLTVDYTYDTDWCNVVTTLTTNTQFPATYYNWTDTDTDGVVDADDGFAEVRIEPTTLVYVGGIERRDCLLAPICTYAEEIQNFANWFQYYRKREFVAKGAYGQIIASARNSRMGMVTLHNNNTVNTEIESMNVNPRAGNKGALLDNLYDINSDFGTPLRSTNYDANNYLGCVTNGHFTSCPALNASQGGECQQNFNVVMTDGFYNGTFTALDNEDGDNDTEWDSGTGGPYGDGFSDTLADIAMKFYEDDLRTGTANKLNPPPSSIDKNEAQHVVTYSVAFGVDGTITSMPANTTDAFAWPEPNSDQRKIDDLRHAAWNGRGEFFSAQNPQQLIKSLQGAISSIQGRVGSAASVAFNSGSLSTNSEVYLALFNSERWDGDLLAYRLDAITGDISGTSSWSAASRLDNRNLSSNPRTILTYDGTDGIPFTWAALSTAQQNDFRTDASGTLETEAAGMARHDYIRGSRACELSSSETCFYDDGTETFASKEFRVRGGRLGDVVHSGPVFVGEPESNWPNVAPFPSTVGQRFVDYQSAQKNRPGVVYVGANDGMLHGFAQSNGDEILAYVPARLFSDAASDGLHYLTDPGYVHRYYADLTPSIADAYIKTDTNGSEAWRTILVGGLRGGGRGVFGLDVTDPTAYSEATTNAANTVLWEFTDADDPDLGYTFSQVSIVPLDGGSGTIRWVAIFGNGYNDQGSGEATLFILDIEAGLDGTWSSGDYWTISTGSGSTSDRNGLATPAVIDADGDGLADRVYAGDLEGDMWVFDISDSNPGDWEVAYGSSSNPQPIYSGSSNQPITTNPVIVRNSEVDTSGSNFPNTMVIFGTGQYLTNGDLTTTSTQALYGIWDDGTLETTTDLVQQTIGTATNGDGVAVRTLTNNSISYGTDDGWYIEFPTSGERMITQPVIRGDLVFFNSMIPDTNPCNYGGVGWQMVAKWNNGGRPDEVSFDTNNDGDLDTNDTVLGDAAIGIEIVGLPTFPVNLANKRYTATTETTGGDTIEVTEIIEIETGRTGRLSWEELTP